MLGVVVVEIVQMLCVIVLECKFNFHALHASYVLVSKILQVVLICQHMGVLTPVILYLPAQDQHCFIPFFSHLTFSTTNIVSDTKRPTSVQSLQVDQLILHTKK